MSMLLGGQVWGIGGLSATEKIVLLKFADYADQEGRNAFPSIASVAQDCSLSERAVQAIVKRLRASGHLEVEEDHDRARHRPTKYRVVVEPGERAAPGNSAPGEGNAPGPGEASAPGTDAPGERAAPDLIRIRKSDPTDRILTHSPPTPPKVRVITDEYRETLHARYSQCASIEEIDEEIALALAHRAVNKTTRVDLYVNNWLRNTRWSGAGTTGGGAAVAGGRAYAGPARPRGLASGRNGRGAAADSEYAHDF